MPLSLAEQYLRQERWRRWDEALEKLPIAKGQRVLDLGCGIGSVTGRLSRLGADAVGSDADEELLAVARANFPDLEFEKADLRSLDPGLFGKADGIWASFVPAYFPDFQPVLAGWSACLRDGGWIALVEIDDLFGHEPLPEQFRGDISRLYEEARLAGRYDFKSGGKLAAALREAGFEILHERILADDELSFSGPAPAEVLQAWRERLQRMGGLKAALAERFSQFEEAFIAALSSENHRFDGAASLCPGTAG